MLSLFQKIFSNEADQPWHGHASESGLPQMILLWDAFEAEGWGRGCLSWRSEQALQEHADPHLYFPATVQLESYKASFSPCRQVAKTTKIKTPTKVLAGYVKHPQYPTTKSCVFSCRHQRASSRGRRDCREHTTTWAAVPGHSSSYLVPFSPCLLHSPFKPKMPAISFCCPTGPCTSAFLLQTQRQSKICLCKPYSHNYHVHFWGHAQHPGTSANLNARENRLASASRCILTSPAQPRQEEGGLNTHILWEQDWYWKQTRQGTPHLPTGLSHLCTPQLCVVP